MPPARAGDDRPLERGDGVRIFGADVDVAVGRADGDAGDGHPLDQHEGIALHDHAVGKGAAVAFVGIADDVFPVGGSIGDGLPLDPGREAGAAAPAQAGLRDFVDDGCGGHLQCPREPLVAVMAR